MPDTDLSKQQAETNLLIAVLPEPLRIALQKLPPDKPLLEVVVDLGRRAEARLSDEMVELGEVPVTRADLDYVMQRVGPLSADNRAGIEQTLHRISAIRNRRGEVVGLTLRVGRAILGTIDMLQEVLESGRNLLLLGRPGVGKTTKLREMARVLADDFRRRVVVVDTSNEIGGDGDVPHPGIGRARRMQVARPDRQHDVMIEAVENHMPEVIIVDEIGTVAEAAAARTIAERGVQLIGTAHGTTLENLVANPTISDLVGGTHTVTLSDEEARRRRTTKTITERRGPPTFDCVIEIVGHDEVLVHLDTAEAVDRLLAGQEAQSERRRLVKGQVESEVAKPAPVVQLAPAAVAPVRSKGPLAIYPYALGPEILARVLRELPSEARLAHDLEEANVVLALRSRASDRALRDLPEHGIEIYHVKKNSSGHIRRALRKLFPYMPAVEDDDLQHALSEIEDAIGRVINDGVSVSLAPQPRSLRKVQHRMAARFRLETMSSGREPTRHLIVYPPGGQPQI